MPLRAKELALDEASLERCGANNVRILNSLRILNNSTWIEEMEDKTIILLGNCY